MDKCWFVLRQTHYPPPQDGKGPIQLGHLIPDLKNLDQVINNDPGPTPFPPAVIVYKGTLENLKWEATHGRNIGGSANADVPIPQTAGLVSVGGEVGVVFQKSVSNFWQFEALETWIIQPTDAYVESCRKDELVSAYIEKKTRLNAWSLFMITGLTIARGAKSTQEEKDGWDVHTGLNGSLAEVAGGGFKLASGETKANKFSLEKSSPFVWAIQLTKISKHMFSSDVSRETYVKGATFSMDEEDVKDMLLKEGIDPNFNVDIIQDDVFVLSSA